MKSMDNLTISAQLDVENIEAGYNGESVLHKISFSVPAGQSLAVVGPMALVNRPYLKCW
jgi:ABC-type multidrug transport system fused ATPase/permease subunit